MRPFQVFLSYSHADEKMRERLLVHLASLQREGWIEAWHDRRILPGQEWGQEIDRNLRSADVVLLLVSADFIASDYCWDVETMSALARHEAGEALVVPIILRPSDWHSAPFGKLQALPRDGKPVTNWGNRDEAWTDVARGLRKALEDLRARRTQSEPSKPTESGTAFSGEGIQGCLIYGEKEERQVEIVARELHRRGIRIWFQKWNVIPGEQAAPVFENCLARSETAVLFVGASGMVPWQQAQYQAALHRAVEKQKRLIPVLLPDVGDEPALPPFLSTYRWVRMPQLNDREALDQLQWGITGVRPASLGF